MNVYRMNLSLPSSVALGAHAVLESPAANLLWNRLRHIGRTGRNSCWSMYIYDLQSLRLLNRELFECSGAVKGQKRDHKHDLIAAYTDPRMC